MDMVTNLLREKNPKRFPFISLAGDKTTQAHLPDSLDLLPKQTRKKLREATGHLGGNPTWQPSTPCSSTAFHPKKNPNIHNASLLTYLDTSQFTQPYTTFVSL